MKDSLNNVLQNARFLNNITTLQDFLNNNTCLAVCQSLNNVLNNNNVLISDLVAIDVLSGGDLIIFTREPLTGEEAHVASSPPYCASAAASVSGV